MKNDCQTLLCLLYIRISHTLLSRHNQCIYDENINIQTTHVILWFVWLCVSMSIDISIFYVNIISLCLWLRLRMSVHCFSPFLCFFFLISYLKTKLCKLNDNIYLILLYVFWWNSWFSSKSGNIFVCMFAASWRNNIWLWLLRAMCHVNSLIFADVHIFFHVDASTPS